MSGQISDRFIFRGKDFSVLNRQWEGLVTPEHYGMQAAEMNTACYRGYLAIYEVIDDTLYLTEFTLLERTGNYKPIGGVMPAVDTPEKTNCLYDGDCLIRWSGSYKTRLGIYNCPVYSGIRVLVPFTGMLQLGTDFIQKYYVHSGYQKRAAYGTLLEVSFTDGKVVSKRNRSKEMREIRVAFKKKHDSSNSKASLGWDFHQDMTIM